jgi:phosphate transport system permease protein
MTKLKYRIFINLIFKHIIITLSVISTVPLILIIFDITKKGITSLNLEFFTSLPSPPGEPGGGILNALIGTFILIFISSVLAIPIGILGGVFLAETKGKFTEFVKVIINVSQGMPSIVIGIIAYSWVVVPMGGFSALSGSIALAIMMLPIIVKNTEETMKLIPYSLKEASYALGVNYTRTILKVVLPSAFSGIASGIVIAISRIVGETAPLLFTAFGNPFLNLNPLRPVDSLPLLIFNYATSPYENWHRLAWGASFVLILFVLGLNITVKIVRDIWNVQF